jgi:hypothetical protein
MRLTAARDLLAIVDAVLESEIPSKLHHLPLFP